MVSFLPNSCKGIKAENSSKKAKVLGIYKETEKHTSKQEHSRLVKTAQRRISMMAVVFKEAITDLIVVGLDKESSVLEIQVF